MSRVTPDETVRWRVMRRVCSLAEEVHRGVCPPELALHIYDAIAEITGVADPFAAEKRQANEIVLSLESRFQSILARSADPLLDAVKLSISGNSMDLGVISEYGDVDNQSNAALAAPLGVDDYALFRDHLVRARHLVMVGDNNGEVVFDRMLMERMRSVCSGRFTYIVRGRPIINDVTIEDALSVGIDRLADIADTGSGAPGLVLPACPSEVRNLFFTADMVVAKGQGNYESLSEAPRDVFFLLMVKCAAVSRELGVPVGVPVLKHHLPT